MSGHVDAALKRIAAKRIDDLVEQLIEEAFERWRRLDWHRYNDLEGNCAIQLYRHSEDARANDPVLGHLRVQLEWHQATPRMLAGLESVDSMKRPDLRVSLGSHTGRTIECKRLKLSESLPGAYVTNGILRFVNGDYAVGEPQGFMVGFVVADDPTAIAAAINVKISAHEQLSATDHLQTARPAREELHRFSSSHSRDSATEIELAHHLVDLR